MLSLCRVPTDCRAGENDDNAIRRSPRSSATVPRSPLLLSRSYFRPHGPTLRVVINTARAQLCPKTLRLLPVFRVFFSVFFSVFRFCRTRTRVVKLARSGPDDVPRFRRALPRFRTPELSFAYGACCVQSDRKRFYLLLSLFIYLLFSFFFRYSTYFLPDEVFKYRVSTIETDQKIVVRRPLCLYFKRFVVTGTCHGYAQIYLLVDFKIIVCIVCCKKLLVINV